MKKNSFISLTTSLSILIILFTFSACKKKFDAPPEYEVPNIITNMTISDLKLKHTNAGAFDVVTDSPIISGIVVADDLSGTFYKQIVIQDTTGAIVLLLDNKNLNLNYPIGRQVFVNCHGLTLSDDKYNGYQTLGYVNYSASPVASIGIPPANISQYVIQGKPGNPVVPFKPTSFAQLQTGNLQDPFLGALIQLDNCQFNAADTLKTWGDITPPTPKFVTLPVKNCNGDVINFNTSSFSNFASIQVPTGKGTVLGIYSFSSKAYNGTKRQLLLRDTLDAQLHDLRCGYIAPPKFTIFDATAAFSTITAANPVSLTGWKNITEQGNAVYVGYTVAGFYAKISNYVKGTTQPADTTWLISPSITIPANAFKPTVTFNCVGGKDFGAKFNLYISTAYDGVSLTPSTFAWDATSYIAPYGQTGFSQPIPSGPIDLTKYAGKTIYLGFKYVDIDGAHNTTFEFDAPKVVSY